MRALAAASFFSQGGSFCMDRNFRKSAAQGSGDSQSIEAWLFAQAILGKPVPNPHQARDAARAERERLEWLAQISPRHAGELRKLQSSEAEARRERELLVWAAGISTKAEAKLCTLLREEAEAPEAQDRHERLYEAYSTSVTEWDEVDHPRRGYGPHPGAWVNKGTGASSSGGTGRSNTPNGSSRANGRDANPHMLELAHT
jgi:hypothetical protein